MNEMVDKAVVEIFTSLAPAALVSIPKQREQAG